MMVSDEQLREMLLEYNKDGKFKAFVDKACKSSGLLPEQECRKVIVYEYYKSILPDGCNRER